MGLDVLMFILDIVLVYIEIDWRVQLQGILMVVLVGEKGQFFWRIEKDMWFKGECFCLQVVNFLFFKGDF